MNESKTEPLRRTPTTARRDDDERLAQEPKSGARVIAVGEARNPRAGLRIAIADPPYLGCCGLYDHHHKAPYGCWDRPYTHQELMKRLRDHYDGWVLHTSSVALPTILDIAQNVGLDGFRVMAWVKPFAAFKANVPVAYAWEPVLVKPCRKPVVVDWMTTRDFVSEPITLERGTIGAKPEAVCMWAFTVAGALPDDELVDLFPGSGAVGRAWNKYSMQFDFTEPAA